MLSGTISTIAGMFMLLMMFHPSGWLQRAILQILMGISLLIP